MPLQNINYIIRIKKPITIFVILYAVSLISAGLTLYFSQNNPLVGQITFSQIVSSFLSIALITIFPGIVLQQIIFKNNPIKELGVVGKLILSYFIGISINVTALIISYALFYTVQGIYKFENAAWTVLLVNVVLLCFFWLSMRKKQSIASIAIQIDFPIIALMLLFVGIMILEIIIVSGNSPLIWGDQWQYLGQAMQIAKNNIDFSTFTTLYFYTFFLALLFNFTIGPAINTFLIFGILSSILLSMAIYCLGRSIFISRKKSVLFSWVCLLSLPFILPLSFAASKYGILQLLSTIWNLESDVTLIPNIFAPQFQFGLPAIFLLVSILFLGKNKTLQSAIAVFAISYVGFAAHIAEIFLFEICLVIFLFLKDDESDSSWFLPSVAFGILAFLLIDYLMPFRWYSMYEEGILSLVAIIIPLALFVILKTIPKSAHIKPLKKTLNSSKIIIPSFLIIFIIVVAGALFFIWVQYTNFLLPIYQLMVNYQIPWFIWATRIIVTLPITFLLYLIYLKTLRDRLHLTSMASKFLTLILFFIISVVLLRISYLFDVGFYYEMRLGIFLMISMAIPTTLLIVIFKKYGLKEDKVLRFTALLLLGIFALNGVTGVVMYTGFWNGYGVHIPNNSIAGASVAQNISLQGGSVLTYSDYPSRQLLFLEGVSKLNNIVPTEAFFLLQKESSFMELANSYNLSTIFLTNYDRELISLQTNDSYIINSLPYLPLYYSNDGTTVNGLPIADESNFSSLPKLTNLCISPINITSSSTINLSLPLGSELYISNESFTLKNNDQYENFENSSLIISSGDTGMQLFFNSNTMEIYGPLETGNILLKITNASSISFSAPSPIIELIQNNITSQVNAQQISFENASLFTINASSIKVSVNGSEQFNELYYVSEVSRNRGLVWDPDVDFAHCTFEGVFENQFIFLDSNISSVVFSGFFNINQ